MNALLKEPPRVAVKPETLPANPDGWKREVAPSLYFPPGKYTYFRVEIPGKLYAHIRDVRPEHRPWLPLPEALRRLLSVATAAKRWPELPVRVWDERFPGVIYGFRCGDL